MKRLSEAFRHAVDLLTAREVPEAKHEAEFLLCALCRLPRSSLYIRGDLELSDEQQKTFAEWIRRRANREPLQYIIGQVEFFDCKIAVTPAVLIPRPETELLVEKAIEKVKALKIQKGVLCDLCCGSGCIGIAIKKAIPSLKVILSDISTDALKIAEVNSRNNQVEVEIRQGDGLSTIGEGELDFLISNPPYIAEGEYSCLEPEVRDFEPRLALIAGVTGFEFYERLALEALGKLKRPGMMLLEIGRGMGERVFDLFSGYPEAIRVVERDYSGYDRFFFLENR